MDRVEMAVELQRRAGSARFVTGDDSRRLRPAGIRALDLEAVGVHDLGQSVGDLPRAPRGAGDLNEGHRRFNQAIGADCAAQTLDRLSTKGNGRTWIHVCSQLVGWVESSRPTNST